VPYTRLQPGTYWIAAKFDTTPRIANDCSDDLPHWSISHAWSSPLPTSFPASNTSSPGDLDWYIGGFVIP
jgi:hypothetical protein